MIVRNLLCASVAFLLACGIVNAQEAPATVPENFSTSAPSISFVSPSIGFTSPNVGYVTPRIEFASPPMTDEELALGPKQSVLPEPVVSGLEVAEVEGGVRYTLSADILFDFDKAKLRPKAAKALEAMSADVRKRFKQAHFAVDGYTDSKGSDSYNLKLSLRRAAAVKEYLTSMANFPADAVATEGRGETNPVAPNEMPDGQDDPEGRQKNRRVEILVRSID